MLKKILLLIIITIIFSTFLFIRNKDIPVFLEDRGNAYIYHFYYDNLTTKNLYNELSFFDGSDIVIHMYSKLDDKVIKYDFSSYDLKKKLGEFFNYYLSLIDDEKEIDRVYINGIKIHEIIIKMPDEIANHYLKNSHNIRYNVIK